MLRTPPRPRTGDFDTQTNPRPSTRAGSVREERAGEAFGGLRPALAPFSPAIPVLRSTLAWLRSWHRDLRWTWAAGIGLALVLWLLVIALSAPGGAWSTGEDAWCYWLPTLSDPYRLSDWTSPVAYVYSPAFLQLIAPLKALSWTVFVAVWTGLLLGAVLFLTGRRLLWVGVLVAAFELYGGNISLFLAVAIVLGFRWPATWAFVVLTKVTPGVGLLWFVARREWRNLAIALGATSAVIAGSALVAPTAWSDWLGVLVSNAGRDGTWAAVPIALWLRLPVAAALVTWGARSDRPWTVPVASMLALPAIWYGSLSMLLALIALSRQRHLPATRAGEGYAPATTPGRPGWSVGALEAFAGLGSGRAQAGLR
jgi:hypothetical protein